MLQRANHSSEYTFQVSFNGAVLTSQAWRNNHVAVVRRKLTPYRCSHDE
jgi:hypothetical protein